MRWSQGCQGRRRDRRSLRCGLRVGAEGGASRARAPHTFAALPARCLFPPWLRLRLPQASGRAAAASCGMAADAKDLYIGTRGGEFVETALISGDDVTAAIEKVQRLGALRNPDCEPLLGLLDHMGQSRAEVSPRATARRCRRPCAEPPRAQVYHAMLGAALGQLKERIPRLSHSALLKLLEVRTSASDGGEPAAALSATRARQASFPFIKLEEVRDVPLSVLDKLNPVPAAFLKQVRWRHAAQTRHLAAERACVPHSSRATWTSFDSCPPACSARRVASCRGALQRAALTRCAAGVGA